MPGAIARLFVELGMDKGDFDAGTRGARGETQSLTRQLNDLRGSADLVEGALQNAGLLGAAYLAKEAAQAAVELARTGAEGLRLQTSFDDLAGRIGTSGSSLITTLRDVSENTVSDMTLMRVTAGLLASGIQTSSDEISLAMDLAQLKAQQYSISTSEAYQRMVDGARKGSVEMLDELGIVIKAESAYKRRAEALGVTVDALSDAQRAEALWKAILEDGRREIEQQGGAVDDYATSFEQLDTTLANMKQTFAEGLTPAVAGFAEGMNQIIQEGQRLEEVKEQWQDLIDLIELANNPGGAGLQAGMDAAPENGRNRAQEAMEATEALAQAQAKLNLAVQAGSPEQVQYYAGLVNQAQAAYDAAVGQDALSGSTWRWRDSTAAAGEETRYLAEVTREAGVTVAGLAGQFQTSAPAALLYAQNLYAVNQALDEVKAGMASVSVDEIGSGFESGVGQIESRLLGLAGIVDSTTLNDMYGEYNEALETLYKNTTDMTDFELAQRERLIMNRLDDEVAAYQETADEEKRILTSMADQQQEFRSLIQSALQSTSVTAEDMGLADIGQYVDKWDENARRLDAVAERGFGELQAHPDWATLLKIPQNVLDAGEQALKDWASRQADAVRNLERPDLLNIDAAVAAVQDEINRQQAIELSLDLVTKAAIDQGLVTGDDAKAQVAQALGLEQALPVSLAISEEEKENFVKGIGTVPVPVTFSTGETEGSEGTGVAEEATGSLVKAISTGYEEQLGTIQWTQTLAMVWAKDVEANKNRLTKEVGNPIGGYIWEGIVEELKGSGIINHIVAKVMAALASEAAGGG